MTAVISFVVSNWRAVLVGSAILALIALGFYFKHLQSENERLTKEMYTAQALVARLNADLLAGQAALRKRDMEARVLAKEKTEALAELEKAYGESEEACKWSEEKIPDSVFKELLKLIP
jgi:hypothetical protein